MEESLKDYLAKMMIGKRFRFVCDCIISMDIIGTIKDYEVVSNEILFIVDTGQKIIKIGENHPKLKIAEIS